MSAFEAFVSGLIQGFTEFLPVSSSGHISVYQYLTGTAGEEGALFSLLLHMGTLLAVCVAFIGTLWPLGLEFLSMIGGIFRRGTQVKFSQKSQSNRRFILLLIVSVLPLIFSYMAQDFLRSFAGDDSIIAEGVFFLVTSLLLFLATGEHRADKDERNMSFTDALIIGCVQALAPLPGISRSGSTLVTALLLGLKPTFAITFSFVMGIPAVVAAILLDIMDIFTASQVMGVDVMLIGLVTSAVSGFAAIFLVKWLVRTKNYRIFAVYTLVLGLLVVTFGVMESVAKVPLREYLGLL